MNLICNKSLLLSRQGFENEPVKVMPTLTFCWPYLCNALTDINNMTTLHLVNEVPPDIYMLYSWPNLFILADK